MSTRLTTLTAAALLALGAMSGYLAGSRVATVEYQRIYPQVVVSYFHTNTLKWRVSVTNDFSFFLNPSNKTLLKFDYIYGNVDGIKKLDYNLK